VLASGCGDGIVRLWDVNRTNQQPLRELQGHSKWIMCVAFSPDGSQLVSGSQDETVRLWSVAGGKLLKVLTEHSHSVKSVAFHPNGKQVASCSSDKTVRVWTVCEWSDRNNHLFPDDTRRVVFCLMCVKARLESNESQIGFVPLLPMALWLDVITWV
jgi:WD40 repeat protein